MIILKNLLLFTAYLYSVALASQSHKASVVYLSATTKQEQITQQEIKASNIAKDVTEFVNSKFKLPKPLVFKYGSKEGPSYHAALNEIEIPYSFISETKSLFKQEGYEEQEITEATFDALLHTLLHELGHALIHMYDLPVVGKEEDAVDDLATILLIEYFENGEEAAIHAARLFEIENEGVENLDKTDFWGEHSLDIQRFYRIMCSVYGSDPQEFAWIKKDLGFPQKRADLCYEDYDISFDNWFTLLKPHLKK